jgi:type VI secretion system VgrG family protein
MTPRSTDPSADRLRPVVFDVCFPHGPNLGWHVVSLRGVEAISQPYEFEVQLFNEDPTLDHTEILGIDCELLVERDGLTRSIFGVVAEVESLADADVHRRRGGSSMRVRIVPAFHLLDQVIDTRFFAGQTVPEIVRDVLSAALAQYDREIDCESCLAGTYDRRDYCVQFRESVFAFCSRIMEEEGIAYVFVPDDAGAVEKMLLVDNNEDYRPVDLLVPDSVPIVLDRAEEIDRESIQSFDWRTRRTPNRVVARGYNMKIPSPAAEGRAERTDAHRPVVREIYFDGEHRQIIDDPVDDAEAQSFTGAALDQRGRQAARVLQRHTLESEGGLGRSNAIGFAVGGVFRLGDHQNAALAQQKFVLVRVVHEAEEVGDPESPSQIYFNRFECVPFERPFRPALRTPRPRVHGVQTGVVVGRTQDEVYTDQFGRVRVKFHRDRHSADDEHASCWIRVAQVWAGAGYGAMVIPRVGMEVVVSFVDGNPDCPLVTGCVYNGTSLPPYALPGELSKSTFKTSSTPGGDGFNELRIEDAHGSEQLFVHAQRRMDVRVRGSLYETTGGNREECVGGGDDGERHGDHNTMVHKDVNHHVLETRYTKVDKEQYTSVGEDIVEDYQRRHMVFVRELSQLSAPRIVVESSEYISHKSAEIELAGSSTISVKGGGKVAIESNNAIELKVGASFISIKPDGIDIQGLTIRLNSGGGVHSATEGIPALAMELLEPLDALAADDGRPGSGGGTGAGGGGGRARKSRTLEPHHAPKMKPPPPAKPGKPTVLPDGTIRRLLSIAWLEEEAWCSEPATLTGVAQNYADGETELVTIINAIDGATATALSMPLGDGPYEHGVEIVNLLPRWVGTSGYESVRPLLAQVAGLTTPEPIRLRFITDLPTMECLIGHTRFDLHVKHSVVWFGGTIQYVRGQIYRIIQLDGVVSSVVPGDIGVNLNGKTNWRYCKSTVVGSQELSDMVYWNGLAWVPVPPVNWDHAARNNKLHGVGVWVEHGVVKTQYGVAPWPDPVAEWGRTSLDALPGKLDSHRRYIMNEWSHVFDIKRQECRSHDPQCCRYMVRCEVRFEETDSLAEGGIIIAESDSGRANGGVWPIDESDRTWAHEFGHHFGNPDEYEDAPTVDPTVNTDGATAGIDPDSIMGGDGLTVKRRHYNPICHMLSQLVQQETGKAYTYAAVTMVEPP